jgi:hypothetical protein
MVRCKILIWLALIVLTGTVRADDSKIIGRFNGWIVVENAEHHAVLMDSVAHEPIITASCTAQHGAILLLLRVIDERELKADRSIGINRLAVRAWADGQTSREFKLGVMPKVEQPARAEVWVPASPQTDMWQWDFWLLETSNNCHRSSGAPNLPANDSVLFSFRFCAVHPKDIRDCQLRQLFEVPYCLKMQNTAFPTAHRLAF